MEVMEAKMISKWTWQCWRFRDSICRIWSMIYPFMLVVYQLFLLQIINLQTRLFASIFYAEKNTLNRINTIENNSWKEHWTAPSLSPWLSHNVSLLAANSLSLPWQAGHWSQLPVPPWLLLDSSTGFARDSVVQKTNMCPVQVAGQPGKHGWEAAWGFQLPWLEKIPIFVQCPSYK